MKKILIEGYYGHTLWVKPNGFVIDIPSGGITHYTYIARNFNKLFPNRKFTDDQVFNAPYEENWIHIRNHWSMVDIGGKKEAIKKQAKLIQRILEDRMMSKDENTEFEVMVDWTDYTGDKNLGRRDAEYFTMPEHFDRLKKFLVS